MKALQHLSLSVKENVLPFIQVLPDMLENRKNDYLVVKIKELVGGLANSSMSFYADFDHIQEGKSIFVETFLNAVKTYNINFIPVISFHSEESFYINLIKEKYLNNGLCIKIMNDRIADAPVDYLVEYVNDALVKCKNFFKVDESTIDLVFDLSYIDGSEFPELPNKLIQVISMIENGKDYRRIIVAAGSFPKDLGDFLENTDRTVYRYERELWETLKSNLEDFNMVYSDYGNIHPCYDHTQMNFSGSCSIKYTVEEDFYILRGVKPENHRDGCGQYASKSKFLINSPNYDGESFSWGDQMISDIAKGTQTPGNAPKWVEYTLNRHISKIVYLLST